MSYKRVDDESISSVGTRVWRSLVYSDVFFRKQLDNRTRKWDSVSLRILPQSEIWCFKGEFGQQCQTDRQTHPPKSSGSHLPPFPSPAGENEGAL